MGRLARHLSSFLTPILLLLLACGNLAKMDGCLHDNSNDKCPKSNSLRSVADPKEAQSIKTRCLKSGQSSLPASVSFEEVVGNMQTPRNPTTILIDDAWLKAHRNDVNVAIEEASDGDTLVFQLTLKVLKLKRTLEIDKSLTFITRPTATTGQPSPVGTVTYLQCPSKWAMMKIKASKVVFDGFALTGCLKSRQDNMIMVFENREIDFNNVFFYKNEAAVFYMHEGADLEIKNSIFKQIYSGRARIFDATAGKVEATNSSFEDNASGSSLRPLLSFEDGSHGKFKKCRFINNKSKGYGCVFFANQDSSLDIEDCYFTKNQAEHGSCVKAMKSHVNITRSTFVNNEAKTDGGALNGWDSGNFTITHSNFTGNKATNAGAFFVGNGCNVKLTECNFVSNFAEETGGAVRAQINSSITIHRCNFTANTCRGHGAVVHSHTHSAVSVRDSVFYKNEAGFLSGAIGAYSGSQIQVENSDFIKNHAGYGGAIRLETFTFGNFSGCNFIGNSVDGAGGAINLWINATASISNCSIQNGGGKDGAAIFLGDNNNATIVSANISGNQARRNGGGILLKNHNSLTLMHTTLSGNRATRGGAILSGMDCVVSINHSIFINNKAKFGGCLHGAGMSLEIKDCVCQENWSSNDGGCFHFESSNVTFERNQVLLNQANDSGGGIYASEQTLLRIWNTSILSNSAIDGGGTVLRLGSRLLCVSCLFENNSAIRGGGLYANSVAKQILLVQLTMSMFRTNRASKYGGGMVVKTFGIKAYDCKNVSTPCDRVILDGTRFVHNVATSVGSSILITKPDNVLVSCEARHVMPQGFMDRDMIQTMLNQSILTIIDPKKLCKSWEDCARFNDTCKASTGTFAHNFTLATNSTYGVQIVGNHSVGFILKNVKSGKPLPCITITSIDAFGNPYAPSLMEGNTLKLNSSEGLREQEVRCSLENGTCTIVDLIGFVVRKNYTMQFYPRSDDILEATNLTVVVQGCIIDEESASGGNLCRECGKESYNFDLSSKGSCVSCPKNANCKTKYIKPEDGYWHKSPCHASIKACIVEQACKVQDRNEKLDKLTRGLNDCKMDDATLEDYGNAQCYEGYEGPLCGSCQESYGFSSSFDCLKCGHVIISVSTLLAIICYLLVGTSVTIKGVLPLRSTQHTIEDVETPLLEANTSTLESTSSIQPSEAIEERNNPSLAANSQETTIPLSANEQQKHKIEIAKQKIVDAWKILLNFVQVTSTAATMDVEWTNELLSTMEKLQVFGAATINSISRPIDCLLSFASRGTRVVWRTLFSIFVPSTVIAILALYWGYRAIMVHEADASYFLKRLLLTIITTTYITYFDLTQVAVRVFNCVVVHDGDASSPKIFTRFWIADTSIECYKSSHIVLIGIALVVMSLVSIGFPLFCSLALRATKNELYITNSWAHDTLSFLCGPFKKKFVYWECVTMIKKAMLSIIIVFSYSLGNQAQGLLILIVLVFFLYLHQLCNPYDEAFNSLNYFEGGSLLTSCAIYTLVQFLNVDTLSEFGRHAISFCLIATAVCFMCIMVYETLSNIIHLLRTVLESKDVQVPSNARWFSVLNLYYKNRKKHHSYT